MFGEGPLQPGRRPARREAAPRRKCPPGARPRSGGNDRPTRGRGPAEMPARREAVPARGYSMVGDEPPTFVAKRAPRCAWHLPAPTGACGACLDEAPPRRRREHACETECRPAAGQLSLRRRSSPGPVHRAVSDRCAAQPLRRSATAGNATQPAGSASADAVLSRSSASSAAPESMACWAISSAFSSDSALPPT
jgi:hypothetical protein